MAFAENLAEFFDVSEFADTATVGGVTVKGIFDADYAEGLGMVSGSMPVLLVMTAAVPTVAAGDAVVIGSDHYTVGLVKDTGTGTTLLALEAA